jgi:hypothetical protein
MKNLKKLGAAVVLTCALGLPVLAGQTDTPPFSPLEPGQTDTPPCVAAPANDDIPTSPSTGAGDLGTSTVANSETSFTEIAADVLLNLLPLF